MGRRNGGLMSEDLKYELAKEMGVLDTVQQKGWGDVPSRMCGSLVRLAIERANRNLQTENR
jgi:small acid-soluble spore protein F (minor alpha/beta-type SASP)